MERMKETCHDHHVVPKMAIGSAVTTAAVAVTRNEDLRALATSPAIFAACFLSLHTLLLLPACEGMKGGKIDNLGEVEMAPRYRDILLYDAIYWSSRCLQPTYLPLVLYYYCFSWELATSAPHHCGVPCMSLKKKLQ